MKLIPASRARWMMRVASSWSGLPTPRALPNIIAPSAYGLTLIPVRPRERYSMPASSAGPERAGRSSGVRQVSDLVLPQAVGDPRGGPGAVPAVGAERQMQALGDTFLGESGFQKRTVGDLAQRRRQRC